LEGSRLSWEAKTFFPIHFCPQRRQVFEPSRRSEIKPLAQRGHFAFFIAPIL
jgi:hypothetical protein